ncbi:MAG: retron Ec67 family RNA-directed DNA polymerase/endonuclease [Rhizobiaceae bacterium]|nr:retron Ec67 family RNA-directed DNA polymerase/endonuclease [Rhizobiaceae bacterium]
MSSLEKLQNAKNLTDLAKLLGFTPKGASYVLYKLPTAHKYRKFEIPKKNGGTRTINAPEKSLSLLQRRMGELLYECVTEHQKIHPRFWHASHGFQKNRTIISNAEVHRRRRFVFNVDIENFFGTLNFGRVRGFFIHDKAFTLDPAIATIIAQIACHDNALPQGSPCSPVISNLIGNILDLRLLAMARDTRCTYTRYADDLTFSTNEKLFPTEIAINVHGSDWIAGKRLSKQIERAGFTLNESKTRMSLRRSRQTVTGLVVNAKANVNIDYYRTARSMCNSLFRTGSYYKKSGDAPEPIDSLNPLEGMLSHIYFVKARRDRKPQVNRLATRAGEFEPPHAPVDLYRKFLLYKHFAAPLAPVIVTEGISDITYLKCAIRSLAKSFPALVEEKDGQTTHSVNFLRPTGTTRDVLNLGHGASGQASLVSQYSNILKKYVYRPMEHPVIILCDNDGGPDKVFKNAAKKCGKKISKITTEPFYHLGENLYLVKVPEVTPPMDRDIEDLFLPALLATVLDGKPFDKKKDHGDETAYGKVVFAEKVVRANASTVDFSGFSDLLSRIDQCLTHYKTVMTVAAPSGTTGTP